MLQEIHKIKTSNTDSKFKVGDKIYGFKNGILDMEDLTFSEGKNSIIGEYPQTSLELISPFKSIRYSLSDIGDGVMLTFKIFHDENNPFYNFLKNYLCSGYYTSIFHGVDYEKINKKEFIKKSCLDRTLFFQYVKLDIEVCILPINGQQKTLFYYPENQTIKTVNFNIVLCDKCSLSNLLIVKINNIRYIYNVFTHEKIEIPIMSNSDGIIVSEYKESYLIISLVNFASGIGV